MTRLRGLLVVGGALVMFGCGGRGGIKPDGAAGGDGAGQAGTSGTTGVAGAGGGPDGAAGLDASDGGDAPVVFTCTGMGGGSCNDNPAVSSIWGVCGTDGRCQCNAGFALNPDTGKCRPAPADGGGDATDGGDGAAGPLPAWQSGPRLRARVLKAVATDDAAIYQGAFDKDLGVACTFTKADDGRIRCMPPATVTYFTDQGCTTPIANMEAGCAAPAHVSRVLGCQWSGFKLGAKVTPAKTYALNPTGTCIELPPAGGRDFYALTSAAATGFVAATEQRDPRGGGLEMRYWKSDDGGLFPIGAWDSARVASCVQGAGAYADRCIPGVVANVSIGVPYFTDAQCKMPLGYVETERCDAEPASAVGVLEPSACGQSRAYVEATKQTGARFRSGANVTCFPAPPPPDGWAFYTPGAAIAPGSLPTMATSLQGAGRLKVRRYLTSATKPIDSRPALYDSTLQDACIPEQTPLGLRCLPETTSAVIFYGDAQCANPVFIESKTKPAAGCAGPRAKIIYREKTAATCGGLPTLELFEVGAAVTVTKIYVLNGTDCLDSGFSPTVNDVFSTTAATDASAAALAYVTE
jgi:hypothetical protein